MLLLLGYNRLGNYLAEKNAPQIVFINKLPDGKL